MNLEQQIFELRERNATLEMTVSMQSAMIDEYKKKNVDLITELEQLEKQLSDMMGAMGCC